MKMIGMDVGQKTIGVAVSDELGWTAQGLTTIKWDEKDFSTAKEEIESILLEHNIKQAVIGLPKNMNGTIGERGEASQSFAKKMENIFHIPTVLWDERLTTMAAERVLLEADMSRNKRKKVIDKMAAMIILQSYLDAKK
ncbi:Holliday junction resolvase RuvX [Aquibacillus sp. 3ASR75-11]|uniref:Putative pre-16S rRNA nuclease n=1 Tax=Terrihalobacillus insolitus TaxID=2950438 RepID=A0A9X3WUJ9_9BACI|nr:Holliday junction resolvase RuvX [Terrihalobacillus insolitus]MDC3413295.1 Holliday junction resolvase RuvX [Terrihalobacillus insolitus]MDC3424878.1 Holliday junction resolvase RuvX [Terrihalobacillus insolitus]